ncbi:GDSL-type esterase/lipase family protein [Paenibacillus cymbidii]|uniref:GDSL-type esterase/lipase family protein n=1 Tax=Paenibacillus cymbidii TaxID=1639034 RepID=UPI0010813DB5|nr:GDSL-type esterase/lipase family protein [Paenibacillus cymbidii]
MRGTRWLWRTTGLIGLLALLLFAGGFVYAIHDILYPQPSSFGVPAGTPPPKEETAAGDDIRIVALGDSLTKGFGDTTGEGYVGKVKKKLEAAQDKPVYVQNYAENGLRASQLDPRLDPSGPLAALIKQANVIVFTIGGNDLNELLTGSAQAGAAAGSTASASPSPAAAAADAAKPNNASGEQVMAADFDFARVAGKLPDIAKRFDSIVAKLAAINPTARIVYVGLYHPYLDLDPQRQGSLLLQQWNDATIRTANKYPNVTVVPTYDLFQFGGTKFLYDDHFHPNQSGYERIAERVAQVLVP